MRRAAPFFLLILSLAACNGPKDNCQDTVDSFYTLWKRHNYDGMFEMLTPEQQKKVGGVEKFNKVMAEFWNPTHSFSIKWANVVESGKTCIAQGEWSYVYKIRGKEPEPHDLDYISWTSKKQADGLWYMELPGQEKIGGF